MNILILCQEYENSVLNCNRFCSEHTNAFVQVLVLQPEAEELVTTVDGGISNYYGVPEEHKFEPDLILSFGDLEDAILLEPRCPIIKMGDKYAAAFVELPSAGLIHEREFPLNPDACKIMFDLGPSLSKTERPEVSADVFDVWVFNRFDAQDVATCMAWGCVVVAPRDTGATDWVVPGITGALYDNHVQRDSLVEELKHDPLLRMQISTTAKQWVYEYADIEILKDLLNRIERL